MNPSPPDPGDWKRRIRGDLEKARRVLVLGVGNPDKGDDGAGVLCALDIKKKMRGRARGRLKILAGYETPENLTGKIRKFAPTLVLMMDAALGPYRPGTVFVVDKDRIEDDAVSTHKISLRMLVAYLEQTVGSAVLVLGIQPSTIDFSNSISPPVRKSMTAVSRYLCSVFISSSASGRRDF